MQEQEGAKPQLTIVTENEVAAAEPAVSTPILIELPEWETYEDKVNIIIKRMMDDKLARRAIDVPHAMQHLDYNQDNTKVRDWMVDNGVLTRSRFDKLAAKFARDARVNEALGFVPQDAVDFVRRYAERERIKLTPRGTIQRSREYALHDSQNRATETINEANRDTTEGTRLIYDVANAEGDNLDSFGRELRLVVDRLALGYRDTVISDAVQTWQEEVTRRAKVDALLSIQFTKGKPTGVIGQAMWEAMERACFDVSTTRPGFAVAVIKKFMWQVKRKARGMPVTNHLMPVLTGAQGKGKTEFVKAMTTPLRDLMRSVDFNMLTDGKTTDIWSALILFIDEMGFFSKADVDQVKNIVTSEELSIRTMRQNHSAVIRNAATLIGCSNKSLEQLIRDDTGVRRFAELQWSNAPDWDASNALDWALLWQSVDENGPDPVLNAGMMDALREQQEANRNQHPVEIWAREYGHVYKKWSPASGIHLNYREWEKNAFPRMDTSQTAFGKQLTALINTMPSFPMEKKQDRNGVSYRYSTKAE